MSSLHEDTRKGWRKSQLRGHKMLWSGLENTQVLLRLLLNTGRRLMLQSDSFYSNFFVIQSLNSKVCSDVGFLPDLHKLNSQVTRTCFPTLPSGFRNSSFWVVFVISNGKRLFYILPWKLGRNIRLAVFLLFIICPYVLVFGISWIPCILPFFQLDNYDLIIARNKTTPLSWGGVTEWLERRTWNMMFWSTVPSLICCSR